MFKEYFQNLFTVSCDLHWYELDFVDDKIEDLYRKTNELQEVRNSKIFSFVIILLNTIYFINSLIIYDYHLKRTNYLCIGGIIAEVILTIITHYCKDNYPLFNRLKKLRYIICYLIFYLFVCFPVLGYYRLENVIRTLYYQNTFLNICFIYFLPFNFIILVVMTIINFIAIAWLQIQIQPIAPYYLIPECLGNFIFEYCIYLIKKNQVTSNKILFYKNYCTENQIQFITNLVDVLNTMVISIKNNEVLYINKYGIDFLRKIELNNSQMKNSENEISLTDIQNKRDIMNKTMEKFFESIYQDEKNETLQLYQKGSTSLSQVIKRKIESINQLNNVFDKIGIFSNDQQIFEVHVRKPNANDEIIEILIYDITQINAIEKTKAETKYKQKILAKIAHEFKTPLITITTLIQSLNLVEEINYLEVGTKKKLSHVINLSSYTLYLIQDIIQYASEETKIKISLSEVKVKENLGFCYDVLQTLIDCNENKALKIKTHFNCDDEIDNLTISSDENKLKQILLNLISNSVKFTLSGFIKLNAYIDKISKALIISVEDTGIGIKEEDYHLIFKENIQLNLDQDYNRKGSGLGLAISKQLAVSLNYQMDFDTNLGKGTKFNLKIPLLNSSNLYYDRDSKAVSDNKSIKSRNSNSLSLNIYEQLEIHSELTVHKLLTSRTNIKDDYQSSQKETAKGDKSQEIIILIPDRIRDLSISNDCNFTIFGLNYSTCNNYIVVIDDYKLVRVNTINIIKSTLKSLNIDDYFILEGSDGIDLLNIIRNYGDGKIKCIFTDENMEYLNGSEAVKIIRKLEQNSKINSQFIVSITAFDDAGTRNNITESGVNTILSKPCTKTKITEILRKIFI